MTNLNNSTEATGDGGLMCSDNPTVHTLHTPIGHSEGSAKSDSKPRTCALGVVWKENMTGVDLKYDAATMAAYPVPYSPLLFIIIIIITILARSQRIALQSLSTKQCLKMFVKWSYFRKIYILYMHQFALYLKEIWSAMVTILSNNQRANSASGRGRGAQISGRSSKGSLHIKMSHLG